MSRRVLITGGAGFIGSHLADELLERGYRVRIGDNLSAQVHGPGGRWPEYLNPEVECILGDVLDTQALARKGVQSVCHLAAMVGVGQSMYEVERYTAVELFLDPGREVLVAASGDEVAEYLETLNTGRAREIGEAARRRVMSEHTYRHRVDLLESVLEAARHPKHKTASKALVSAASGEAAA